MKSCFRYLLPVLAVLFLTACAAGDTQFTEETPAGFWYGLWHGIIAVIALIIHLFNDNVMVYEINNTGGWYDFGFLLGMIMIWSGGSHASCKSADEKKREQEWEEVCEKVERKIMRELKDWAADEDTSKPDPEWDEVKDKAEHKLKRLIREWAEKE